MQNRGDEDVIAVELVDEIPPEPTGLVTDRLAAVVAKLDELAGNAANRILDERSKVEAGDPDKLVRIADAITRIEAGPEPDEVMAALREEVGRRR